MNNQCEFCYNINETVEMVVNPSNDSEKILLCETCYENACDNVTYY